MSWLCVIERRYERTDAVKSRRQSESECVSEGVNEVSVRCGQVRGEMLLEMTVPFLPSYPYYHHQDHTVFSFQHTSTLTVYTHLHIMSPENKIYKN